MDEWVWSNGGMILMGENWSTGRKTLYSVGDRWMNEYGAMVEWYWQGKTEVLGEKHYTVWVIDGWMSMEQWWNDTCFKRSHLSQSNKSIGQVCINIIPKLSTCPAMRPTAHVRPIISARRAYRWKFVWVVLALHSSDLVVRIRHALQTKKTALRTMMRNSGPTVKMRSAT